MSLADYGLEMDFNYNTLIIKTVTPEWLNSLDKDMYEIPSIVDPELAKELYEMAERGLNIIFLANGDFEESGFNRVGFLGAQFTHQIEENIYFIDCSGYLNIWSELPQEGDGD